MISVIVNLDSRPGGGSSEMGNGPRHSDFLVHQLVNKRQFFSGIDHELIAYVDEHEIIPDETLRQMRVVADVVVVSRHSKRFRGLTNASHDVCYLQALSLARGEMVCHFDGDVSAFARSQQDVEAFLEDRKGRHFLSYPSPVPNRPDHMAVHDDSFNGASWVSTRFFYGHHHDLHLDDLAAAIANPDWFWMRHGPENGPARRCDWTEHYLSWMNGHSVYYPPLMNDRILIWTWGSYMQGLLPQLNAWPFESVRKWVDQNGGIVYPNDVHPR